MKVTIELDEYIIAGIAHSEAEKAAYDWFGSKGDVPDANELYAAAFADGVNYLLDLIEKQK